MSPPTYSERLRLEGGVLAASGGLASVALLAFVDQSRRDPASTIGQLVAVGVLLAVLAPRSLGRSVSGAERVGSAEQAGSGEPTPLWHALALGAVFALAVSEPLPGIPAGLTERAGWDAGLRVTGGCTLVGVAQVALSLAVGRRERGERRTYFRAPGSRLLRGTKLAYVEH